MRREGTRRSGPAVEGVAETLVQDFQPHHSGITAQNECTIAEAADAIEGHPERWHHDGGHTLLDRGDEIRPKPRTIADVKQRHAQMLGA